VDFPLVWEWARNTAKQNATVEPWVTVEVPVQDQSFVHDGRGWLMKVGMKVAHCKKWQLTVSLGG